MACGCCGAAATGAGGAGGAGGTGGTAAVLAAATAALPVCADVQVSRTKAVTKVAPSVPRNSAAKFNSPT